MVIDIFYGSFLLVASYGLFLKGKNLIGTLYRNGAIQ